MGNLLPAPELKKELKKGAVTVALYWRVGLLSSAPGGSGPNVNRITLVSLFLFMGSMKHGLSQSFYRLTFFS